MNNVEKTLTFGQSIWLDYIERSFIESGELQGWIKTGVRGMTSNPAIFQKAISNSYVYDDEIAQLAAKGSSPLSIYESLAIADIRAAADLFLPIYRQSSRTDGYVSLEVNPEWANDTEATVAEAHRLFAIVDRPNLMIKIPATPAGFPAISRLIADGINVNVTLIFGLHHYRQAAEAYLAGLQLLEDVGKDLSQVASVASFFVSRLDTAVDAMLQARNITDGLGQTAIAQSRAAFDLFSQIFSGNRWQRLAAKGARVQRLLWASTSTKNPNYSDTLYVDELIGENTVNTLPLETLKAFLDHGQPRRALPADRRETEQFLDTLAQRGIDLLEVSEQLQKEGVAAFKDSFNKMLSSIDEKTKKLLS